MVSEFCCEGLSLGCRVETQICMLEPAVGYRDNT